MTDHETYVQEFGPELERRAAEAKQLAELYYCQQDYESSMKLDIRARALSEALQLARGSLIDRTHGQTPPNPHST